jgi:hypothetical protein
MESYNKVMRIYYTYAYLREDGTPYYIGKGKGDRIYSKQRGIKAPKDKSRIILLKEGLTEEEAFKHEIYMIAVFGRKDLGTGTLRNRTNGGEGASGAVRSAEARKNMSKAQSGRTLSEGHKKKISEANTGKIRTEEFKRRVSELKAGIPLSEEHKEKLSESKSGEKNPQFGKFGASNPSSKAIIAIQPDGTELHFSAISEASRELGIDPSALCGRHLKLGKVLKKGKFKGWQFLYKNS